MDEHPTVPPAIPATGAQEHAGRAHTVASIRFDEASGRFLNTLRRERRIMTDADYGDPAILKKTHVPNGGLA